MEVIWAGAGTPPPPPVPARGEAARLEDVPPDLDALGSLWPQAEVYLQDEGQGAVHPTRTRVWGWQGRRGQRLVEAPGANDQVSGFGLGAWCAGWCDGRLAPGRTADIFGAQVRAAGARSRARGRMALVIVDNLRTHPPPGSKLVRQRLAEWQAHLRIIDTPAYEPDANRSEWRWRWSRREVTHHHQRPTFAALLEDIQTHCEPLRQPPDLVLRQMGSPFAEQGPAAQPLAYAA